MSDRKYKPVELIDAYFQLRQSSQVNTDVCFVHPLSRNKLKNAAVGKNYFAKSIIQATLVKAGLDPKFVPRPIRAITATQLFRQGVTEQLISETSDHRSTAVRTYSRSNDEQTLAVQRILLPQTENTEMDIDTPAVIQMSSQNAMEQTSELGNESGTGSPRVINSLFKQSNLKDVQIHVHYHYQ